MGQRRFINKPESEVITTYEPEIGSIWETRTKSHKGHIREIVGVNKNGTRLRVRSLSKLVHQHREKIYSIAKEVFLREHRFLKVD